MYVHGGLNQLIVSNNQLPIFNEDASGNCLRDCSSCYNQQHCALLYICRHIVY